MRVLIDVDGVLLKQNIYIPQAECIVQACLEVAGAEGAARALSWDWVGRTDHDILRHACGIYHQAAKDEYLRLFRHACPEDLTDEVNCEVAAAVGEAVNELGFSVHPVTGNFEGVARMKLTRARYTPLLAMDNAGYGEGGARPDILRGLAERLDGHIVYVGDTWRDKAAAELVGVPFIGWETEKHRGELPEPFATNSDELVSALADAAWGAPV